MSASAAESYQTWSEAASHDAQGAADRRSSSALDGNRTTGNPAPDLPPPAHSLRTLHAQSTSGSAGKRERMPRDAVQRAAARRAFRQFALQHEVNWPLDDTRRHPPPARATGVAAPVSVAERGAWLRWLGERASAADHERYRKVLVEVREERRQWLREVAALTRDAEEEGNVDESASVAAAVAAAAGAAKVAKLARRAASLELLLAASAGAADATHAHSGDASPAVHQTRHLQAGGTSAQLHDSDEGGQRGLADGGLQRSTAQCVGVACLQRQLLKESDRVDNQNVDAHDPAHRAVGDWGHEERSRHLLEDASLSRDRFNTRVFPSVQLVEYLLPPDPDPPVAQVQHRNVRGMGSVIGISALLSLLAVVLTMLAVRRWRRRLPLLPRTSAHAS
jgi:hypothetical protein